MGNDLVSRVNYTSWGLGKVAWIPASNYISWGLASVARCLQHYQVTPSLFLETWGVLSVLLRSWTSRLTRQGSEGVLYFIDGMMGTLLHR